MWYNWPCTIVLESLMQYSCIKRENEKLLYSKTNISAVTAMRPGQVATLNTLSSMPYEEADQHQQNQQAATQQRQQPHVAGNTLL